MHCGNAIRMSAKTENGNHVPVVGMPTWVEPMAATLTQDRFSGPEWLIERKYDGIRMLAFRSGDDVKLYSRNRLLQHAPALERAILDLPVRDVILDGEAAWHGGSGYHVFDIVWLNGHDLTELPLHARRAMLHELPFSPPLLRVEEVTHERPWEYACAHGWEGVIAKRRDAPYEQKRSKHWLKMKCEATQEFVVGGFTDPQRSRVGLGALLVGYYEGDDFVFAGKVGTGFDTQMLVELRSRLDTIEIEDKPFTKGTGLPRLRQHWVKPEIVVQVSFIEWTGHGKLRHSRLITI